MSRIAADHHRRNRTREYWRGRHVVYRCYEGAELVYIGTSSDPAERLAQHRRTTPWWPRVTRVAVKVYRTRAQAFAAEREAIRAAQPPLNVRHISTAA